MNTITAHQTHLSAEVAGSGIPKRTCSIDGCGRIHKAHGFCRMHYLRLIRHGDPLTVLQEHERSETGLCSIDGCGRIHYAKGLCNMHRIRLAAHGDPSVVLTEMNQERPSYDAAHRRVRRAKGRASTHACEHCGGQAQHWAYSHTAGEAELTGLNRGYVMAYSADPQFYLPLCVPCHARFDHS